MSKLKTNTIQHTGGSADNITLDNSQNVTVEGNLNTKGDIRIETDGDYIGFGNDNDLQIRHDGSHALINNSTGRLRIQGDDIRIEKQDGSEFMAKFTADGAAELYHNDTLQCSTSANGLAFPSGKGIDFSATGDASGKDNEVLNDYERGTWTPGITFGGGNTNWTYSSEGHYQKVGQVVTCIGRWDFGGKTSGYSTGECNLTGLPFTVGDVMSGTSQEGFGTFTYFATLGSSTYSHFSMWVQGGDTRAIIQGHSPSSAVANLNDTHIAGNSAIRFIVIYYVNPT